MTNKEDTKRRVAPAWLFWIAQALRSPETAYLAAELRRARQS